MRMSTLSVLRKRACPAEPAHRQCSSSPIKSARQVITRNDRIGLGRTTGAPKRFTISLGTGEAV